MASDVRFYNVGDPMEVFQYDYSAEDLEKAKEILEAPLKKEWIKQRDTGFGKKLDYIEGARVIEILNKAFNYRWSFDIIATETVQAEPWVNRKAGGKEEPQGKYVQVIGRLTVPGLGSKMAIGSKSIIGKTSEQESVFKAAMTDALKKAATLFGVGKELYLDDPEVGPQEVGNASRWQNAPTVQAPAPQVDPWQAVMQEVIRMKELKAVLGIEDNAKLSPFIKDWSKGVLSKAEDITPDNIKAFVAYLQSKVES